MAQSAAREVRAVVPRRGALHPRVPRPHLRHRASAAKWWRTAASSRSRTTSTCSPASACGWCWCTARGRRSRRELQAAEAPRRATRAGLRITDDVALACAKEASGRLRVEIEALLSMGLPNSPMAGADIRVASGNFVTAQARSAWWTAWICSHTGEVRKIDAAGDPRPAGRRRTGAALAARLLAHRRNFQPGAGGRRRRRRGRAAGRQADLPDGPRRRSSTGKRGELRRELTCSRRRGAARARRALPRRRAARTCRARCAPVRAGVKRVHLLSRRAEGALLLELFTHRGVGTMITAATRSSSCARRRSTTSAASCS